MNIIITYIVYIGQCIYSTLPAIFANMAPIFVKNIPILNYPLDFDLKIKGKLFLGPKKTFRGLFAGIIFSMTIISMQYIVFRYTKFKNLGIIDFNTVNFLALGFLMGFGVIFGDAFASFIKRRLGFAPSKSIIFLDQLDCVIGGLLFGKIAWNFPIKYGITIIILTFFFHILGRHIGYYLGLCESKW